LLAEAIKNNILPLTGRCNLACLFCSNLQNPGEVKVFSLPPLSEEKLSGLVPLLDGKRRIVIGESVSHLQEGEPFTHPHLYRVLKSVRKYFPRTPVQLTTNGSYLNKHALTCLKELKPLELVVSLNSSSEHGRREIMGDRQPRQVLDNLKNLSGAGIPFHGSLVALPHLVGWEDFRETVKFLDKCGALTIRIFLPGYTRYAPSHLENPPGLMFRLCEIIENLKEETTSPLLMEPPGVNNLEPRVEGVLGESPAYNSSLREGDVVHTVNGDVPRCRVEAYRFILESKDPVVRFCREGEEKEAVLTKEAHQKPGTVFYRDLDPADVEWVRHKSRGMESAVFTSPLAFPMWKEAVRKFGLEQVHIHRVEPAFWGGSIVSAGLLTLCDFSKKIEQLQRENLPSLIFLPGDAFDAAGKDLLGRNYLELEESLEGASRLIL